MSPALGKLIEISFVAALNPSLQDPRDLPSIARSPHIRLDPLLELLYYNPRGVRKSTLMKPQPESLR